MRIARLLLLSVFFFSFFFKAGNAVGQTVKISGKILQVSTEVPLQGISIFAKTGRQGTVSTINGSFQIMAMPGDTLYFRSVGYKTLKYLVTKAQVNLKILLAQESMQLKEVEVNSRPSAEKINRALRNMKRPPEPDPIKAPPPPVPLFEEKEYTPNAPVVYKNPISFMYDQFSKEGKQNQKIEEILKQRADSVARKKQAEDDKLFLDRNKQFK